MPKNHVFGIEGADRSETNGSRQFQTLLIFVQINFDGSKSMQIRPEIEIIVNNIEHAIIGKRFPIVQIITALLAEGHVLIEDVPGVGKTQLVSALSKSLNGVFNRIQMTPDVMPSDILGYTMIHPETKQITYQKGAALCNFLLTDEINRASPKSQSSLLEVMEERQISLEGHTFPLPKPFMTLATQNPVETYGTYHLPEAQMDRFLMRISMGYPDRADELTILNHIEGDNPIAGLQAVMDIENIVTMQNHVKAIVVHELLKGYIMDIVEASRRDENIKLGVSPRGSLALQRAAKSFAFVQGRSYVLPEDIQTMAVPVLAHRIMLSPKGKSALNSQNDAIHNIISRVNVPVARA